MKKSIRFYCEDNKWYADIPEHTKEDNEMVFGADDFLEEIGKETGEVTLGLSDEEVEKYLIKFSRGGHDEDGAEYLISGPLAEENYEIGFTVWICNVTHTVFGEHPETIYLTGMR